MWGQAIDLGRWPDRSEITDAAELEKVVGGLASALRFLARNYDVSTLESAALTRRDDLMIYLVNMILEKRLAYRQLEPRLQLDIKTFFGDYSRAQEAARALLTDASNEESLLAACRDAAERGLGWLQDDHSLQLHVDLVERLPAVLRAYVACGMLLWDSTSDVQLVKIHIGSGKLTLLEFEAFDESALPPLRRRIKINMRRLPNIPLAAQTYNALHALAVQVLDPVVEYFGNIRLSYGFCSSALGRHITRRVAPRLDQHACHEVNERGRRICSRGGAACDFIVDDEDMEEVAAWIAVNAPFDRMYIYGRDKPLHVSYGPDHSRSIFRMKLTAAGDLVPVRAKTPSAGSSAA